MFVDAFRRQGLRPIILPWRASVFPSAAPSRAVHPSIAPRCPAECSLCMHPFFSLSIGRSRAECSLCMYTYIDMYVHAPQNRQTHSTRRARQTHTGRGCKDTDTQGQDISPVPMAIATAMKGIWCVRKRCLVEVCSAGVQFRYRDANSDERDLICVSIV